MSLLGQRMKTQQSYHLLTPPNQTTRQNESQNQEEGFDVRMFEPETLDEHLDLLSRVHLKIKHIPQLLLKGNFHDSLQMAVKIYYNDLHQLLRQKAFQQKIEKILGLIQTYQQLINQYGLFVVSSAHIRGNLGSQMVIWINQNYFLNRPDQPLNNNENNQAKISHQFANIFQPYFNQQFFTKMKFSTLAQLEKYLQTLQKRNLMHQRCSRKARQSKRKNYSCLLFSEKSQRKSKQGCRQNLFCFFNSVNQSQKHKYAIYPILNTIPSQKSLKKTCDIRTTTYENKGNMSPRDLEFSRLFQQPIKTSFLFGSQPIRKNNKLVHDLNWSSEKKGSVVTKLVAIRQKQSQTFHNLRRPFK